MPTPQSPSRLQCRKLCSTSWRTFNQSILHWYRASLSPGILLFILCNNQSNLLYTFVSLSQESYFHWAFGVLEPDFLGAIEVDSGRAILFAPRLPASYAVWMGAIETPDEIRERYQVAEVHFVDEVCLCLYSARDPSISISSWNLFISHMIRERLSHANTVHLLDYCTI